jgi:hypothetical protein
MIPHQYGRTETLHAFDHRVAEGFAERSSSS